MKEFLTFVAEDSLTPTRERIGGGEIRGFPQRIRCTIPT